MYRAIFFYRNTPLENDTPETRARMPVQSEDLGLFERLELAQAALDNVKSKFASILGNTNYNVGVIYEVGNV